jgi:hypothetical protein
MYIRFEAAAKILGLDVEEIERLVATGEIPPWRLRRLGREISLIDPGAIEEAIRGGQVRYRGAVTCV